MEEILQSVTFYFNSAMLYLLLMQSILPSVIIALLSNLSYLSLILWVYNSKGFRGLIKWMRFYRRIFRALCLIPALPVFFLILSLNLYANFWTVLSTGVSLFVLIAVIAFFIAIQTLLHSGTPPKMNLITKDNPIAQNGPCLRIAFTSDPHWGAETSASEERIKILKALEERKYDAAFFLGDMGEFGVTSGPYEAAARDINTLMPSVKFHALMGNHDALLCGEPRFRRFFSPGDKSQMRAFHIGNVHIITMNLLWDAIEFDRKAEAWLIETLEAIPESDTVIFLSHAFGFSSGYEWDEGRSKWYDVPDMLEKVYPILIRHGVKLAIAGHNHHMEFIDNPSLKVAVIGTMGGVHDLNLNHINKDSAFLKTGTCGWLEIVFRPSEMQLTFFDSDSSPLYKTSIPR